MRHLPLRLTGILFSIKTTHSFLIILRYGASEGAMAVILKSRKAALRDGDTILAVIKSTDIRHDGRSQGLVAPNVKAQIEMQRALLAKASLSAAQIE